jgi:hypothetical protein
MASAILVGTTLVCHFDYRLMFLVFFFFSQGPRGSRQADECVIRQAVRNPGGRVRFGCPDYPTRIHDCYASFDVDLPMEIDDEYWENEHEPDQAFKQPAGKPSVLSYFVSLIKLIQILAVALRTIVSHAPPMLLCLTLKGCRSTRLTSPKSSSGS